MTKVIQAKFTDVPKIRSELLEVQNNICPLCGNIIKDPVLDHHHKKKIKGTGLIRGVLCRTCNVFLGKIENNSNRYGIKNEDLIDYLNNVISYLKSPPADNLDIQYIHPSEKVTKKLTKKSYNELKKILESKNLKIPKYTSRYTKALEKLFKKYNIEPTFYK